MFGRPTCSCSEKAGEPPKIANASNGDFAFIFSNHPCELALRLVADVLMRAPELSRFLRIRNKQMEPCWSFWLGIPALHKVPI